MTTSTITSERIDDIPLLLHWLLAMQVDKIIDAVLRPPHGNRQGLKLPLIRHDGRNALAAVPSIALKITVTGQYDTVRVLFGHTHQAGIGQRHGHIGIPCQQRFNGCVLVLQAKGDLSHSPL